MPVPPAPAASPSTSACAAPLGQGHGAPLLDRAGILARLPHQGRMALLDAVLQADAERIRCRCSDASDPAHPLRTEGGLLAPAAIELAAQAMAVHGALTASPDSPPIPGFLAAVRQVRLHAATLHDAPGPLQVSATRQAGNGDQALYAFELHDATGRCLVDGRATVVLNTPLTLPPAVP